MSVVALPRRLSLDFTDVFDKGFGFDKIETDAGVQPKMRFASRNATRDRWDERDRSPGQTSYETGDDSEDWDPTLAGSPPPSVALCQLAS